MPQILPSQTAGRAAAIVVAAIVFVATLSAPTRAGEPDVRAAKAAATAFARHHLARRDLMFMCGECLARKRRLLTPELMRLLLGEIERYRAAAKENGGEDNYKPFVAGDVFTGTEGTASAFRVGRAEAVGAAVHVGVTWTFRGEPGDRRDVTLVMVRRGGRWLVDDVVYDARDTLVDLLERPEYDSYGT